MSTEGSQTTASLTGLEGDVEEARGGGEDAGLHLVVGEVGADTLRVEVELRAAVLLAPIAGVGCADGGEAGLLLLREGEQLGVFAGRGGARDLVHLVDEILDTGGRADHLVGGGEVGVMGVAESGGQLLARGKEISQHLDVGGIGALVVGQVHSAAQIGVGGEGETGRTSGCVGGEGVGAVGGRLVEGDVVGGQAVELVVGGGNLERAVGDVAAEGERERGDLVLEGADFGSRGVVFVDAGEPVLEERALEVVAGGRIVGGQAEWRPGRRRPSGSGSGRCSPRRPWRPWPVPCRAGARRRPASRADRRCCWPGIAHSGHRRRGGACFRRCAGR